MTDTYTSSKGETMLIKDMENPHLIHSIAKLAKTIGNNDALRNDEATETDIANEDLLKSLKAEAIARLSVQAAIQE